ncbi:hypothetical protein GCM10025865_09200 [Paraoerskovia sediminicola]|uniref:Tyr recombinase domain-containing protein n=1 Tax=Paraoerskovia sediminicola TaxID=1138587 RepID=A0ABM8G0I8_9CELL|nr:site-specific integrase [Paraoerskovia sediminicola]BDZ41621.1 hypothetical protein GCM10025865_09200 [Paraoerskovia sediminicola]
MNTTTRATSAPRAATTPSRHARRGYGQVRQERSGRWRALYTGPDGTRRSAGTHDTRAEAEGALAAVLTDVYRGSYRAPDLGALTLSTYARRWLARQDGLAPRTLDLYRRLADRWLLAPIPATGRSSIALDLGALEVRALTPGLVADWHAAVVAAARTSATARAERAATVTTAQAVRAWALDYGHPCAVTGRLPAALVADWQRAGAPMPAAPTPAPNAGRTQAAQAYRLLRTICSAAVRERMLSANPCQVRRGGQVRAAERTPATPAEVELIAAAMPERYRAAVLVAAWSGLRASELFALERRHIDLEHATVRVEQSLIEVNGQPITFGPPKSDAGRRTVALPPATARALAEHLDRFTGPGRRALVFATASGRPVHSSTRSVAFGRARAEAGRPDLRWHDLRHTGATRAAEAGATLAELQRRLGHSTVAAALIYQHATDASDRRLAARMADLEHPANVLPLRPRASA